MKKITKKKTLTAVTGATVIGVAAAALVNGSKLEAVFNPEKFEKFQNNYSSDEYDYVAGDGEETDIAGENSKDEKAGGNDLQVLQLKKQEKGDLQDSTSFGIAEEGNSQEETGDPGSEEETQTTGNGIELSQMEDTDNADKTIQNTPRDFSENTKPVQGNASENGSSQNGNNGNGGSGPGGAAVTPAPSQTPDPTGVPEPTELPIQTPEPTTVPDEEPTPTPEPTQAPEPAPTSAPVETPAPAPTFVPTPTLVPPTPTPKPWEDKQLDDKDPVTTEDGQLIALDAEITKEYYAFGETYQEGDGKVTATFLQKDGTKKKKALSYGGKDGYSVTLSTVNTGRQIAVFSYKGVSARAYYTVMKSNVTLNYMAFYDGEIYSSNFPGIPLKNYGEDLYNELKKYTEAPYNYASYGKYANLTEAHKRYIAILGDSRIQKEFADTALGGSYASTVFLETGEDGYLTNMLEGFRWVRLQGVEDSRSYLYYPIEEWNEVSRNVIDYVVPVPDGYKIRRVAENENDIQYSADQVLEQYTGTEPVMRVPMGVTRVRLTKENTKAKILEIPQSVEELDIASLGTALPSLEKYQTADGDELRGDFRIIDGILYSRDGKTLLSVPAGCKKAEIPSTVTTLGANCLKGLSSDAVISFKGEKAPSIQGETGFKGTIQVADSKGDTICKNYMFAFGKECNNIDFETESRKKDLYQYNNDGPVLFYRDQDAVLAAIPQESRGEYTIGQNIQAIGKNAFAGCDGLTDLIFNENIKELKEGSLILPGHMESVTIKNPDIKISDHLFGTPGTDEVNLNVKIYVPAGSYERMLEAWSRILDPVYGEDTAVSVLCKEEDSYFYEDGVKYQQINSGGKTEYRLVRVYQRNKTAIQVKKGTAEIAAGAFAGCEDLEILFIPDTVQTAGESFLSGCSSLEMVVCGNQELFAGQDQGAFGAEILTRADGFADFEWDNGVIYGKTAEGYTLLNVPTDYDQTLVINKGTTAFYKNALRDCQKLYYITIQDDEALREIGEDCFRGCAAIDGVSLEDCKNLKTIGDRAFYECSGLVNITLPESLESIGNQAFYNCTLLEKISAPAVRVIGDQAFYGCGSLMTADLFTAAESLGDGAFYGCTGLSEVILPETLSSMGESCFENCTMLKKVVIDGTLAGISRYCFYGCRSLVDITFQDISARSSGLRVIGVQAFGNCTSLETVDLSRQTALTAMGEAAFTDCVNLTTVKLPGQLLRIPDHCFRNCPNLSILQLESEDITQPGERIFGDTLPSFIHIWVKEGKTESYQNVYEQVLDPVYGEGTTKAILGVINDRQEIVRGVLFEITDEGRVLEKASTELSGDYTIPEDTVRIADRAFEGCNAMTGFCTPAGSSVALGDHCFQGCTGLKQVRLLGNITQWGEETFMDCTDLEKISLGYDRNSEIDTIGVRAFKNCTGLQTDGAIEVRAQIRNYGEECFAGCTNLPAVSMSDYARASLKSIGAGAFRDCASLRSFLVSKFSSLTYIGDHAFANCDTLKQPAVPAKVTYVGEGCFMDCDNIMYVSFYCGLEEYPKDCFKNCPKLVRTGGTAAAFKALKRIGESAYEGCVSLTVSSSWNLGRYVNLEEIGDRGFYGCATMTDSVLSDKMTKIGAEAFEGCSALHALWIQAETPPVFGAFSTGNMAEDFLIRVPDSQEQDDSIYKAYLEKLTELLGKDEAYRILDSFSDEAKSRQTENASEAQEFVDEMDGETTGDTADDTPEGYAQNGADPAFGVIEEVTETPETTEAPTENVTEETLDPDREATDEDNTEMPEEMQDGYSETDEPQADPNGQSDSGKPTEEAKENEQ